MCECECFKWNKFYLIRTYIDSPFDIPGRLPALLALIVREKAFDIFFAAIQRATFFGDAVAIQVPGTHAV